MGKKRMLSVFLMFAVFIMSVSAIVIHFEWPIQSGIATFHEMWLLWAAFIGLLVALHLPLCWELIKPKDAGPRQFLRDVYPGHKLYVMTSHVLSRCHDPTCDVCGLPLEVGDTVVSIKSGRSGRKWYHWGNPSSPSCYRKIYPIDQEFTITSRR